jgi:hypothetical protein
VEELGSNADLEGPNVKVRAESSGMFQAVWVDKVAGCKDVCLSLMLTV